jgi:hypothetical protein
LSDIPNPGSLLAAVGGCTCFVTANNVGRVEPEGGWKIRATCPVHGAQIRSAPVDAIVAVPSEAPLGWWGRLRVRLRRSKAEAAPQEQSTSAPPEEGVQDIAWMAEAARIAERDMVAAQMETREVSDIVVVDVIEPPVAVESPPPAKRAVAPKEVGKKAAAAAKKQPKNPCAKGHWFTVYGEVGLRSPVCVRCGAPSPKFTKQDQAKYDRYMKRKKG